MGLLSGIAGIPRYGRRLKTTQQPNPEGMAFLWNVRDT
ncbi:hypothetical protein ADIS_4371 [Lunatimonas lonarensis]|uniref:Uncharacterized protein n=1 Tax=Lunatimonas lonarensis TaxID=1232681 RepID=R7ZM72_9BACT|nr:hypothetical protein ADIS_4371 [Lunatimonas lonarensis]